MKTYTYLIKPAKEITLEQLRKELIAIEERFSDEELVSIIKLMPEQQAALLTTPNKDFVSALLKDKRFVMVEHL